ncbi:MAG TPA: hypothetical protein VEP71_05140, partial [Gallionella sp.]|nr:hypothetical protein [Gallionella sp.]
MEIAAHAATEQTSEYFSVAGYWLKYDLIYLHEHALSGIKANFILSRWRNVMPVQPHKPVAPYKAKNGEEYMNPK